MDVKLGDKVEFDSYGETKKGTVILIGESKKIVGVEYRSNFNGMTFRTWKHIESIRKQA